MKSKIIQIVPLNPPVLAIYSSKEPPKTRDDLFWQDCQVAALVQTEDGEQEVVALELNSYSLDVPDGDNFLGYAESVEAAVARYIRS